MSRHESTLLQNVAAGLQYAWHRRAAISILAVVLWVPTELAISFIPEKRSTLARLGLEGFIEPLWTAAIIHLRWLDSSLSHDRMESSPLHAAFQVLRRARRSYARLIGIRAVLEFRLWFGLLALVVPGIVMFTRYAFMDILAVVNNVGPTTCRQHSATLVEGRSVGIFVVLVVGMLLPMGLSELFDWWVAASASRSLSVLLHILGMLPTVLLPLALFETYAASQKP